MSSKNTKRWCAVFDTHGDAIDREAEREFFDFLGDYKPQIRVGGGDHFDFRGWRRGADESERGDSMQSDIESGVEFLKRFNPSAVLLGNHDDRLWRIAREGKGDSRELARLLIDKIEESLPHTKFIPYNVSNGICRVGDIAFLHGYICNLSTARFIAQQYGGSGINRVVQGHVHHFSSHTSRTRNGTVGHTVGCLARLDMEYAKSRPATMSHSQGWCYGEIRGDVTTYAEYRIPTKRKDMHVLA